MEKIIQFMPKILRSGVFEVAAENNIHIIEENLGNQIAGYYNITHGEKLIHVNSEIPRYYKEIVIAYFLPKNTNKCTQEDSILFLTMNKITQLQNYLDLDEAI